MAKKIVRRRKTDPSAICKTCSVCGETKPKTQFFRFCRSSDGFGSACKVCSTKRNRSYEQKCPERVRETRKRWYSNPVNVAECKRRAKLHREKNRDRISEIRHLRKYGLTRQDYIALITAQGNRCAICGVAEIGRPEATTWFVDHDHETGEIRGLLCNICNIVIGLFEDDPARFEATAAYLRNPPSRKALSRTVFTPQPPQKKRRKRETRAAPF